MAYRFVVSFARRGWSSALLASLAFLSACRAPELERTTPAEVGLSSEKLADVRAAIEQLVAERKIPGAVALVARRGRIAWLETVGLRDVARNEPMTEDTIFRICSMTKPVTSVAAMMLVEEGRLSLDDPVSKFIPEFANATVGIEQQNPDGTTTLTTAPLERPVTIEHLLTHTSGLAYQLFGRGWISEAYRDAGITDGLIETDLTNAENARRLARVPLLFQPGTAWEYGLSVDVLGRVIEVASGQPLDEFFRERIFSPLGMRDTYFHLPAGKRSRLASVYQPRSAEDPMILPLPEGPVRNGAATYSATYPVSDTAYLSGGAGLVTTITDYARFLLMLEQGGELDGVRILRPDTVALMTRDHCPDVDVWIPAHGDGFGLGFGVVTEDGKDAGLGSAGTFSWGGFYYTYFWVDPTEDLVGIFFSQIYPWMHLDVWNTFRNGVYAALTEAPTPSSAGPVAATR